jgi:tetratricopeptide (TPR) repeat protein
MVERSQKGSLMPSWRLAAPLAACLTIFAAAAAAAPSSGGPWIPSSVESIDAPQSFQDGRAALEAGDFKKAEKKFGEVLSVSPKHPEANYYMGRAKAGRGKDQQAAKYFARALKERENFIEAREQLALASVRLGDNEEAQAQLAAVKAIAAACAAGTCEAAFVERAGKAVERITEALAGAAAREGSPTEDAAGEDRDPLDDEQASAVRGEDYARLFLDGEDAGAARYRAAVANINIGDYETAIADLGRAQALLGPHPDILNYLGYAHRKLGAMAKAEGYYREALALAPGHLGAHEYLGELYLEIGDMAAARKRLTILDGLCVYGCAEREALARLIAVAASQRSAAR